MHFQGLNLNLLVSLDALLSEKSVTRAAERLNVTQPAMSTALRKLRVHLEDPLLERVGQHLDLTPRAREIAGSVKDLLQQINALLNSQPQFDPTTAKRTFRVAMSGYMAELLGAPLIDFLLAQAPGICVQFADLATDSLRRVEEGEFDFCITVVERELGDTSLSAGNLSEQLLFSDQYVLVAAQRNAAVTGRLTYAEFCAMPYVELRFGGGYKSIPDLVLDRQQVRPRTQAWMTTSQNVLSAVSATAAVAIVPSRLFELHRTNLQLKSIKPPLPLPNINQKLFCHVRSEGDPGHRWFGQTLRSVAEKSFCLDEHAIRASAS
ncbi:MAG: LysR family transcriptional regulator [Devosia sp.]|jgi:DNA-binding transcriptional LysR family regulator|nr:LysR family transcriptional regulator [Devosia sp.]